MTHRHESRYMNSENFRFRQNVGSSYDSLLMSHDYKSVRTIRTRWVIKLELDTNRVCLMRFIPRLVIDVSLEQVPLYTRSPDKKSEHKSKIK